MTWIPYLQQREWEAASHHWPLAESGLSRALQTPPRSSCGADSGSRPQAGSGKSWGWMKVQPASDGRAPEPRAGLTQRSHPGSGYMRQAVYAASLNFPAGVLPCIKFSSCKNVSKLPAVFHPLFMISHHTMTFTNTLFMWSYPGYLSLHPLQLSYYLQFIDYSMSAICVISNHYIYDIIWILCDITTILSDIKRRYSWHHIHTIPYYRPTVYDMPYTTLVTSLPL